MSETSRRRFIGVAGAGAAAGAAATVLPATAVGQALRGNAANEPIVAHVADVSTGLVTLMVGEREVVVRDVELVTRLRNAAGSALEGVTHVLAP